MRFQLHTLLATLAIAAQAHALSVVSTDHYAVAKGEILTDEQWVYSDDAAVNGQVEDDLFLFSGNLMELGGTFENNVWGMGNHIDLSGNVHRN